LAELSWFNGLNGELLIGMRAKMRTERRVLGNACQLVGR